MHWLQHLINGWQKYAEESKDDATSQGPPNLRAAAPLGPSCDKCAAYNLGMGTCTKYGIKTHPQQVCDDFEEPEVKLGMAPSNPLNPITLASPSLKPISPMANVDGSTTHTGHPALPATQLPQQHPAQQPLMSNQRPSVVAQVSPNPIQANIANMFTAQPRQKMGGDVLTNLFIEKLSQSHPFVLRPLILKTNV